MDGAGVRLAQEPRAGKLCNRGLSLAFFAVRSGTGLEPKEEITDVEAWPQTAPGSGFVALSRFTVVGMKATEIRHFEHVCS